MGLSAIFAPDKAEKEKRKDDDESAGGYKAAGAQADAPWIQNGYKYLNSIIYILTASVNIQAGYYAPLE